MRILLVADLHYRLAQLDWLLAHGDEHDVVVVAGDHLNVVSPVALEAQIVAVRTILDRLAARVRVCVCSGNHDLDSRNDAGEKTTGWLARLGAAGVVVDGESATIDGTMFTMLGWWDGPTARDRMETALEVAASSCRRPWVWGYHAPPPGPLSWTGA
ncbi:MAG: metallophosphoesterase family protein, partial [Acidimicrobiales bacterium]